MKILASLLLAFAIGLPSCSNAADLVVGSISCKEWLEDRASPSSYMNQHVDQSWVIGFLSGYSSITNIDFLANVDSQSIFVWMDNYCKSHPLKRIDDGAFVLAHELIQKMDK